MNNVKLRLSSALIGTMGAGIGVLGFGHEALAKLDMKISGQIELQAIFFDQDTQTHLRGYELEHHSSRNELHFDVTGTNDAGLNYGGRVDWRYANHGGQGQLDELYIFAKGRWGELRFGDDDGAGANRENTATLLAGSSGFDGSALNNIKVGRDSNGDGRGDSNLVGLEGHYSDAPKIYSVGDSTKIVYYTPYMAGFQGTVSFAPAANNEGYDNRDIEGDLEGMLEGSLRWKRKFGDYYTGASVVVTSARWQGNASARKGLGRVRGNKFHPRDKDFLGVDTGLRFGYKQYSVVAAYGDDNVRGRYYSLAVSYKDKLNHAAVGWIHKKRNGSRDELSGLSENQHELLDIVTVGYTRTLVQGLQAFAEYNHIIFKGNNKRYVSTNGNTWIVGTKIKF